MNTSPTFSHYLSTILTPPYLWYQLTRPSLLCHRVRRAPCQRMLSTSLLLPCPMLLSKHTTLQLYVPHYLQSHASPNPPSCILVWLIQVFLSSSLEVSLIATSLAIPSTYWLLNLKFLAHTTIIVLYLHYYFHLHPFGITHITWRP